MKYDRKNAFETLIGINLSGIFLGYSDKLQELCHNCMYLKINLQLKFQIV